MTAVLETVLQQDYAKFCEMPIKKFVGLQNIHLKLWVYNCIRPLRYSTITVEPSDIILPIGRFYKLHNESLFVGYGIEFPNYAIINAYDHYISANKVEPKNTVSYIKMVFNSNLVIFVTDVSAEVQAVMISDYNGKLMLTE